jgi:hypothetical protein
MKNSVNFDVNEFLEPTLNKYDHQKHHRQSF